MYHYLAILLLVTTAVSFSEPSGEGFSRANAARIKPLESKLLQTIRPENCRREHRIFTEKPHMAGSLRNYELAQYVAKQWRAYGLEDVQLIEHPVYLPWPVRLGYARGSNGRELP